jgi:hypothetical protein
MGMAPPDDGPKTDLLTSDQEAEWAQYEWFRTHNRKARRALKAKARKAK